LGRSVFLWLGLVVQAGLAIYVSSPWMTGDSDSYLALSDAIQQGNYGNDVLRPPGYPILLALWPFGIPALMVLQEAVWLVCLCLVSRMAGQIVLWLALIYPFPAMYVANVGTEAWAMLTVTLAAWLLTRDNGRSYALAGVAASIGTMFRSDLLLLPVAIAVYVIWRNWRLALVPVVSAAAAMLPYSLWNLSTHGQFKPTPLAGALGNSLYSASWQPHVSQRTIDAFYEHRATPEAERTGLADEVRQLNRRIGAPELTAPWNPATYPTQRQQIESVSEFGEAALERIKADPLSYARHVASNIWALWNTRTYPPLPAPVEWALRLSSALVWLLGLAGLLLTPKRLWGPLAVLLYVPAVHLWLHTEARYTASVRPLLLLVASLAVVAAWRYACKERCRRRN
jgi:hypothetical protein